MNIVADTAAYEQWLTEFFEIYRPDLEYKHTRMSDPDDPYAFFRGTYYRWARRWPVACPDETQAPRVLTVGDLHIENFGTWRDSNGRLCWGVNDFDEADELPYTNDLVRLAASARVARAAGELGVKSRWASRAILTGYRETLEAGGMPFVLEERHPELRALAMAGKRDPVRFWKKLTAVLDDTPAELPASAREVIAPTLPSPELRDEVRYRQRVGVGSLGRPRYVLLAQWCGGWIAREVKAVAPPATAWLAGRTAKQSRMAEVVARAVRCADPFYHPGADWIVRRLAPQCSRIELGLLASAEDILRVLWAMGCETANVHLGTPGARERVLDDLVRRPSGWLADAAKAATQPLLEDWQEWIATADERDGTGA